MLADDVIRNFEVQKFCLFNAQKVLPDQFARGLTTVSSLKAPNYSVLMKFGLKY